MLALVAITAACAPADPPPPAFPGPFLMVDRLEIRRASTELALVRADEHWRIDDTPFFVDAEVAEAMETMFRREWVPDEIRPTAHTAAALELTPNAAATVRVFPADRPPVTFLAGRVEAGAATLGGASTTSMVGERRWILPEGTDDAGLIALSVPLTTDPMSWRADRLCAVDTDEIDVVSIDGVPIASRDRGEWVGDGVDSYRVEQLVRRVGRVDGEPIAPVVDAGEPDRTISLAGSSASCNIGLHAVADGTVLSVDGVAAFRGDGDDLRALIDVGRRLGDRTRVNVPFDLVVAATVRTPSGVVPLAPNDDGPGWAHAATPSDTVSPECERFLRTVSRLEAEYDAREAEVALTLPHAAVTLRTRDTETRVRLIVAHTGEVFARVGAEPAFRVAAPSERILRSLPCHQAS